MIAANDQALLRRSIAAEIDRLIALLDTIDGDCDLEDNGDLEPSLGGSTMQGEVDLEHDPFSDAEPDLGWSNDLNQANVHRCSGVEGDRSDFEPEDGL